MTTSDRDPLVGLALQMSKHAEQELEAEGFHTPMYVLWPEGDRQPFTRGLDDTSPAKVAGWGQEIARVAAESDAVTAVLIMESWAASPSGRTAAQEVLIVAVADALGQTVIVETPVASDGDGRRHIAGERTLRPEHHELSAFEPLKAFWAQTFAGPSNA